MNVFTLAAAELVIGTAGVMLDDAIERVIAERAARDGGSCGSGQAVEAFASMRQFHSDSN